MKILFDNKIFINQIHGGPSVYFINLIENLQKQNKSTKLCSYLHLSNHLNQNKFLKEFSGYKLPFNNYMNQFNTFKKLVHNINKKYLFREINKFNPMIYHSTYYENYDFNKINTKYQKVITVFDLITEKFSKFYGNKNNFPKKKIINSADKIICISENTKKDLKDIYNVSENKICVTYLGYPKKFLNLKKLFKFPYILFVGTRWKYKNFDNFIKAYSMNTNLYKNFKVVIFGGGKLSLNEKKLLHEYKISNNQIIHYEGNDFDLHCCYKFASLFVYPTFYEGFGLPILESFLYDCPVNCSNASSLPEVAGNGANFFDPFNAESISLCMERTLFNNSDREKLIQEGKKQLNKFSWEKCATETLKFYNL